MLQFFAKRLKELHEVERDERGFTLIELLVVIIIIGILAAIAIPAFLAQREQAWEAAAQSDLRNAAAAAQSCAVPQDGDYTLCDTDAEIRAFGYRDTEDVTLTMAGDNAGWTGTTVNTNDPDDTTYELETAGLGRVECIAAC
jgi:type IV pilus assembly protein PilA